MPKMTYHGPNGKFCPPDAAKLATREGERYKVVRGYQRVCSGAEQDVRLHVRRPAAANDVVQRAVQIEAALRHRLVRLTDLLGG